MKHKQTAKVPTSRLSRLSSLGGLASRLAGNVLVEGAKRLSQGQKPSLNELVMTPSNITHMADKLAELRGAAMKVGQMLSMDSGELLPKELSDILSRLRSDAKAMPHKQLVTLLKTNWGNDWLDPFAHFELNPFAAASIGQVHLATLASGEKLAVKLQYPGIRNSIDSDIDNVAAILKLSKLIPSNVQFDQLLAEAKKQLHVEADYQNELSMLQRFQSHIANNEINADEFIVPTTYPVLCNQNILVMEFIDGQSIESINTLEQVTRNNIATRLLKLFFKELFAFKLMQTDPNFANYQYQAESDKLVLLDFGATRAIPSALSDQYKQLMAASIINDRKTMENAAQNIGFFQDAITKEQKSLVLDIFYLACEPLRFEGDYDFSDNTLAKRIKQAGMAMSMDRNEWHSPPADAIFIHRKLAGLYLLASKIGAKVNVKQLFEAQLQASPFTIDT
ncbi:ubiquinol-cytochrome C reductase [Shewanella sp. Choline-02u-19]|uniref:ABC1 kinase family protein n=1 Tax=unclassified Shewanella TaxID=196818 RepID=UPI000C348302|nr:MULTISPECIES: AarF/ABC1/UbiB kinase family protein [unclassified Shewanella]PKH54889.1 ubiquinol-cytochrome C reductase [Shewanella sp. Bg11-22]PKI26661.1 ubiquinol-cytochrome C reductase [Shewanella sp. Choline-02u-19]